MGGDSEKKKKQPIEPIRRGSQKWAFYRQDDRGVEDTSKERKEGLEYAEKSRTVAIKQEDHSAQNWVKEGGEEKKGF